VQVGDQTEEKKGRRGFSVLLPLLYVATIGCPVETRKGRKEEEMETVNP